MTSTTLETKPQHRTRDPGAEARLWWERYCHPQRGDPAVRAELRRCRSPQDALLVREAIVLARRLSVGRNITEKNAWRLEQSLNLARVLAHVSADSPHGLMEDAGWKSFPGDRTDDSTAQPLLSELRFRRLIQAERGEELVAALVRLVQMLGGTANVGELANAFVFWGDRIKKGWTFSYYAAGIATPRDVSAEPSNTNEDDDE